MPARFLSVAGLKAQTLRRRPFGLGGPCPRGWRSSVCCWEFNTLYNALQVGQLAHQALLNGTYGSAQGLAQVGLDMLGTFQYQAEKEASKTILETLAPKHEALALAGTIQQGIWSDQIGDRTVGVARLALSRVAGGFEAAEPIAVLDYGLDLIETGYEPYRQDAQRFKPVAEQVLKASSGSLKSSLKFGWQVAQLLPRAQQAAELLSWATENELPRGDAGRLELMGHAWDSYLRGLEEVNADQARAVLHALRKGTRNPNRKKAFTLAAHLAEFSNSESVCPKLLEMPLRQETPLDDDRAVIGYVRELAEALPELAGGERFVEFLAQLSDAEGLGPVWEATTHMLGYLTSGDAGGSDLVELALEETERILDGGEPDLLSFGRKLAHTRDGYGRLGSTERLFEFLRERPEFDRDLLSFGHAVVDGYGDTADRLKLAEQVLDAAAAGRQTTPIEFAGELYRSLESHNEKNSVIESLTKELKRQFRGTQAGEFVTLANELTSGLTDYANAGGVFEAILDKVSELESGGRPLHLVDDSLDVINLIPDRFRQANALRRVVLKYAESVDNLHPAMERPLSEISCLAGSASEQLQLNLDLLNIVSRQEKNPQTRYALYQEVYRQTPDELKDIVALSRFRFMASDPGSVDLDTYRDTWFEPEHWQSLGEVVRSSQDDSVNLLDMMTGGLEALKSIQDRDTEPIRGAAAYILLQGIERRNPTNAGVLAALTEFRVHWEHSEHGPDSERAEEAVYKVFLAILESSAVHDTTLHSLVGYAGARWTDEAATNREILLETLKDMGDYQRGRLRNVLDWKAQKVLGENNGPALKITKEDDYVVVGGMVLPRRKG